VAGGPDNDKRPLGAEVALQAFDVGG
jgi:hypothetical protein